MVAVQTGNIKSLLKCVQDFMRLGYSAYQVISQLADILLNNDTLEATHKTKIFEKLGVCIFTVFTFNSINFRIVKNVF